MTMSPESLFREIFLPLYPEGARADLTRTRREDRNPGENPSFATHLDDAARIFAVNGRTSIGEDVALDFTDDSVHRLSRTLTQGLRDRLLDVGPRGSAENALFNFVVHGTAYVGACIVAQHRGRWSIREPLWESLVTLTSRAGTADLAIFQWWLKALAGSHGTLADRYRTYVELPCTEPERLPILAPRDRRLPKLAKVRYDAFYKYLRAHLPELGDLGENFPSPERFEEYRFKSLGFLLVGGGRMLVVHGATPEGLHAFWLTKDGFEKAAFWPCDAFPEPILQVSRRAESEHLEVVLSKDGEVRSFELLWWGP